MRPLVTLALLAATLLATPAAAAPPSEGFVPPELKAVKWYNAPDLSLEDLRERAVLLEVFRTW